MKLQSKVHPNIHKGSLIKAVTLGLVLSCAIIADETTIADLNARIDDLERQIEGGAEKTDDVNPGSSVTMEDLERLKEEVRTLRGKSDDINSLHDELRLLREDIKILKEENSSLRAQKGNKRTIPSKEESPIEANDEKPIVKEKRSSLKQQPDYTAHDASSNLDEEAATVLEVLEKSTLNIDQEETESPPKKNQKKNTEIESVREVATKHAEKTAPKLNAGNAEAQYNEAFLLHNKGEFKKAEEAFSDFIETYPNHDLTSTAMYWKAESCMRQKNNKNAKILFVNAYKKNAKGSKAPDCLLKLGEILAAQGKKSDACTAWRKLSNDFSHMTSEMKSDLKKLTKQNGCEIDLKSPEKPAVKS